MKKLKTIKTSNNITLKEGYDEFINYCKINNYSEYTIKHYKYAYRTFRNILLNVPEIQNVLTDDFLLSDINLSVVNKIILYWRNNGIENVTLNSYVTDLRRFINFWIDQGYVVPFQISSPKVTKTRKDTYSEEELQKLLKKPNLKKCSFNEYTTYIIENILVSTGLRATSLINIKICDVDLNQGVIYVRKTKNRQLLSVPISRQLISLLKEFIRIREPKDNDDWLICNAYGEQLKRDILYRHIAKYNKSRGVSSVGVHKFRHTFAKQWIISGGSVVTLSKILGHSNIGITDRYINMLVDDIKKNVDEVDILSRFNKQKKRL